MYVCIHIDVQIHTHTQKTQLVFVQICLHTHILHRCLHAHIFIPACIYVYTYLHIYNIHTNICMTHFLLVRMCIRVYVYMCVHIYTQIWYFHLGSYYICYIYVYTYIYRVARTHRIPWVADHFPQHIRMCIRVYVYMWFTTKYTSLWRKMTYEDKGSYESSPPCIHVSMHLCVHIFIYKTQIWYLHLGRCFMSYICMCLCMRT